MNAERSERKQQTRAAPRAANAESVVVCSRVENDTDDKGYCENVATPNRAHNDDTRNGRSPAVECGATQVVVDVITYIHEWRRGLTRHKISCGEP